MPLSSQNCLQFRVVACWIHCVNGSGCTLTALALNFSPPYICRLCTSCYIGTVTVRESADLSFECDGTKVAVGEDACCVFAPLPHATPFEQYNLWPRQTCMLQPQQAGIGVVQFIQDCTAMAAGADCLYGC